MLKQANWLTENQTIISRTIAIAVLLLLQACSGGSGGGSTERDPAAENPGDDTGSFTYSGPTPANTEIQAFKREFFDNLAINGRCGDCHTTDGPGPTLFVDRDDVNNAYQEALSVVDLLDPASSLVVQRVTNGHNCWLGSDQTATCRTTMIGYINNWASSASGGTTTVQLLPRTPVVPSGTKRFPETIPTDFSKIGGLHELLTTYCSDCHTPDAPFPQSPYFASSDVQEAYEAVQGKINLIDPSMSRLVIRVRDEGHNCWTTNCDDDANELQAAIVDIAEDIAIQDIDPAIQDSISKAQVLASDGILASNGGRYEEDIIAEWKFSEGMNPADIADCINNSQCTLTTSDTSGVQPEITLTLSGDVELFSSGGVRFNNGSARGLANTSIKLRDRLAAAGEYTIEAWVIPDNVTQEDTSILSYSGISDNRNLMFGQTLYNYDFYNRSSATDDNGAGEPVYSTDDDDELAQATLQHVVMTYDPVNGRRIYVNGLFAGVDDEQGGGNMANWNDAFSVVIGNDASGARPWKGILRYMALHSRALTEEQIQQNNDVGIGLEYYLLFSVSHLIDSEGVCHEGSGTDLVNYCYIVFKVSQFDEYSYSFSEPRFVSLNEDNFTLADTRIKGVYIGINGKLIASGQAFSNVDVIINDTNYVPEQGIALVTDAIQGSQGTIVALEDGSTADQFFLAFEDFGGALGVEVAAIPTPTAFSYSVNGAATSDIAVRTFEELNASFARITGISTAQTNIHELFYGDSADANDQGIKRQLPSIADFQAYQASHQTAVAQLAIAYCDALVEDNGLRAAFFNDGTAFDFSQRADLVPDIVWQDRVIYPLLRGALVFDGANPLDLASQPDRDASRDVLLSLINDENDLKPYKFDVNLGDYASQPDGNPDGLARCDGPGAAFDCPAGRTEEVVKAVCAAVLGSAAVVVQ